MNTYQIRPSTSTSRGLCRYYNTPRGCFAGRNCKFVHGEEARLTPFDANKTCRFYASGFCKRGENCWFKHGDPHRATDGPPRAVPVMHSESDSEYEERTCAICLETPPIYGLLTGCSHVFCLACLKAWRDPNQRTTDIIDAGVHKKCPMCRSASRFVIPSSIFYKSGDPKKEIAIERYKESMRRVKCRYFEASLPGRRYCPFGSDCFYRHVDEDGTDFVFEHGVDHYMRLYRTRNNRNYPHRNNTHPVGVQTTDPFTPVADLPNTHEEMMSLVETLVREVTNLSPNDQSQLPGITEHINTLVNRLLDWQNNGASESEDEDDSLDDEDDLEEDMPRSDRRSDSELSEDQESDLFIHSLYPVPESDDELLLGAGVAPEYEDATRRPPCNLYSPFVVGSPRNRGDHDIPEEDIAYLSRTRTDWEEDSEDELLLRSPKRVPLPVSPILCSPDRRRSVSSHCRRSSSISSSHLVLSAPPQQSCLVAAQQKSTDPIAILEDQERTEIIESSILVNSPEASSLKTAPTTPVSPARASDRSDYSPSEYQSDDPEMEDLVRSVHKTLLGQSRN